MYDVLSSKKENTKRRKQMIKELMHDLIFLAGKSEVVTKDDLQVARDAPHPTVPFLLFTVI